MTKGDITLYCKNRFGNLLRVKNIQRALMNLQNGKLGRGVLVNIQLLDSLSAAEMDSIRVELQNDLNAKSAFFTDIKVTIQP